MRGIKLAFSLGMLLFLTFLLQTPQQIRPGIRVAPGAFFSPFTGFWQNGPAATAISPKVKVRGIEGPTRVLWDENQVPHIYAANARDLAFLQGYLCARERLWEMEFLARRSGGSLAEMMGPQPAFVQHDRYRRKLGIRLAAENTLKRLQRDSTRAAVLEAYSNGVNAWIAGLDFARFPVEYKILNRTPEPWTPLKTVLISKGVEWEYSGYSEEMVASETRAQIGDSLMAALFYRYPLLKYPLVGDSLPGDWGETGPAGSDSLAILRPDRRDLELLPFLPDPHIGSNAWAVAGKKSSSGAPILCADSHTPLHLPNLFMEMHLSQGKQWCYGAALPGIPGVWSGFNAQLAWGLTNGRLDLVDWYELELRPEGGSFAYRTGSQWKPLQMRIEEITTFGGKVVTDTLWYDESGLVLFRPGPERPGEIRSGRGFRWNGLEADGVLPFMLMMNFCADRPGMANAFKALDNPSLGVVYAWRKAEIGIQLAGRTPVRRQGMGRYLSEGSLTRNHWNQWLTSPKLPSEKNPFRGFVVAANQLPMAGSAGPYLQGNFAGFERANRLGRVLNRARKFSPKEMMSLQTDNLNQLAQTVLPQMIDMMDRQGIGLAEAVDLELLREWDRYNYAASEGAVFFEYWWAAIEEKLWEERFRNDGRPLLKPNDEVTAALMLNNRLDAFLLPDSTLDEDFPDGALTGVLLQETMEATHRDLITLLGPQGENWAWGKVRGTDLQHLAGFEGFGQMGLPSSGNLRAVNAIRRNHGPSWRMVVEMGDTLKAWTMMPGGQSGNPGEAHYGDQSEDWLKGRYRAVFLWEKGDTSAAGVAATALFERN